MSTAPPPLHRLSIFRLAIPLRSPWRTACGTHHLVETLYARAEGGPHTVWFESCPLHLPVYAPECAASAFAALASHLAPMVLGAASPADACARLHAIRGNEFARNLLEGCAWQLAAAAAGQPLQQLIGGQSSPSAGITLSLDSPPDTLAAAIAANPGRRIRCKFTGPADMPALRRLRALAPDTPLWIDCNGAFSLDDLPLFRELDDLPLQLIEQPLHWRDLHDHARLQSLLRTPIALDESITCRHDAATAARIGAARAFNLKPGRLGGISELLAILPIARAARIDCFIGGMLETDLAGQVNQTLATLPGITLPSDLPAADRHFARHPAIPVSEDTIAPFTIQQFTLSA